MGRHGSEFETVEEIIEAQHWYRNYPEELELGRWRGFCGIGPAMAELPTLNRRLAFRAGYLYGEAQRNGEI